MKNSPGFLQELQTSLEKLTLSELDNVNRVGGLEVSVMLDHVLRPRDFSVHLPEPVDDQRIVQAVKDADVERGKIALQDGTTAFCVLAGGSGTRAGGTKALLRLPHGGKSLLQLKIEQASMVPDVWVMVSPSNRLDVERHLEAVSLLDRVKIFEQYESFRLTPDNRLSVHSGKVEMHPCGHGDVIPALQHSGLLDTFRASGGRHIVVVNSDNVLASPPSHLVGQHLVGGKPVTCEVVERQLGDNGGVLCSHAGFDQVVEMFRLTSPADYDEFKWLSTNTFVFDADLDFESIRWSWHRVKKTIENRLVVQYERLLQELTAHFQTQFVVVPRSSRFMPVKTQDDLQDAARIFGKNVA